LESISKGSEWNGLELYDKAKLRFNKATILHDDAEHDLLLVTTEQDQEIKQHLAIQEEFDLAEKRMKKINHDLREIQELLDHDGICCRLHLDVTDALVSDEKSSRTLPTIQNLAVRHENPGRKVMPESDLFSGK
jgi:hypothetical protein